MSTDITADHTGRERGFHPAHVGHLVMGLATDEIRWLLPLPWVFAGAAGLLAAIFSGRRRSRPETGVGYSAPAWRPDEPAYAVDEPDTDPADHNPEARDPEEER